jgi:hypothetical protein
MLDPQRFTRGVPVVARDLEPVMVRRLKSDLRRLGEAFPERVIDPISIADLPDDALTVAGAKAVDGKEFRHRAPRRDRLL